MQTLLDCYPGDAVAQGAILTLLQATAIIALALAIAGLLGRHRPAVRHGVCLVALIYVLLTPLTAWLAGATNFSLVRIPVGAAPPPVPVVAPVPAEPPSEPAPTQLANVAEPLPVVAPRAVPADPPIAVAPPPAPIIPATTTVLPPRPLSAPDKLRAALVAGIFAWAGGVLLLAIRLVVGWRLWARLRSLARPVDPAQLNSVLPQVQRTLGLQTPPRILLSDLVPGPVSLGVFRPVVILPGSLLQTLRPEQLREVLIHECAHLLRRDPAAGVLQRIAQILFWPHPLLHWLNGQLSRAREEVCDNYVLGSATGPEYAQTLLDVAEDIVGARLPATLTLIRPRWRLEDRVAGLLDHRRNAMTQTSRRTLLALAGMMLATAFLVAGIRTTAAQSATPTTAASSQPTTAAAPQPRQYVRVVVGDDEAEVMNYHVQGQKVEGLASVVKALKKVPDRSHTVLQFAVSSDRPSHAKHVESTLGTLQPFSYAFGLAYGLGFKDVAFTHGFAGIPGPTVLAAPSRPASERSVLLVIGMDNKMIFQDKLVTLDSLPGRLAQVPDRPQTHMDMIVYDNRVVPDGSPFWELPGIMRGVAEALGFEYASYVGLQDPASKGDPTQMVSATSPSSRPAVPGPDAQVVAKLQRKQPNLRFEAQPVGDVIQFLRDVNNVNIVVNWKALENVSVDRNAPVTVQLKDVTLDKALRVILDDVGAVAPLAYAIDDNVIAISQKESLLPTLATVGRPSLAPNAGEELRKKLQAGMSKAAFENQPLEEVLQFFGDAIQINMHVKWRMLEPCGINKQTPVTVQLKDVSLEEILRMVFWTLSSDGAVAMKADSNVLTVSTRGDLQSGDTTWSPVPDSKYIADDLDKVMAEMVRLYDSGASATEPGMVTLRKRLVELQTLLAGRTPSAAGLTPMPDPKVLAEDLARVKWDIEILRNGGAGDRQPEKLLLRALEAALREQLVAQLATSDDLTKVSAGIDTLTANGVGNTQPEMVQLRKRQAELQSRAEATYQLTKVTQDIAALRAKGLNDTHPEMVALQQRQAALQAQLAATTQPAAATTQTSAGGK